MMVPGAHAAQPDWLAAQTGNVERVSGPFVSVDYGFSVSPPPGAQEYVTKGGDANHGVRFILGEGREIYAYPQYSGPDLGSPAPCSKEEWGEFEAKKIVSFGSARLGKQVACEITARSGQEVWRVIQGAGDDRGTPIEYTLFLVTEGKHWAADNAALREVAASFRRVKVVP